MGKFWGPLSGEGRKGGGIEDEGTTRTWFESNLLGHKFASDNILPLQRRRADGSTLVDCGGWE